MIDLGHWKNESNTYFLHRQKKQGCYNIERQNIIISYFEGGLWF